MPPFLLSRATEADIPLLARITIEAWTAPFYTATFPPAPEMYDFWLKAHANVINDPDTHFLVVRDTAVPRESDGATSNSEVNEAHLPVALGRLLLPNAKLASTRFPDTPATANKELAGAFLGSQASARARYMGSRPHYYLEIMGTSPAYFRKGVASMMLEYCCKLADQDGVEIYLGASESGYPLYLKFGFEVVGSEEMPRFEEFGYTARFMIRQPRSGKEEGR